MNNYLKSLSILAIIFASLFYLSACAKQPTYDTLQSYVEDNTIIGNYYTQDFIKHDVDTLRLNVYAPRQQPKYLNLNFQADGNIYIENIDLNIDNAEHLTGKIILQSGRWEKVKDNIYKIKFTGMYFAESSFIMEAEYAFVEHNDLEKSLKMMRPLQNINKENDIF